MLSDLDAIRASIDAIRATDAVLAAAADLATMDPYDEIRRALDRVARNRGIRRVVRVTGGRDVAMDGSRAVHLRHRLWVDGRVVAHYGIGHRYLYWREA